MAGAMRAELCGRLIGEVDQWYSMNPGHIVDPIPNSEM
jgi:hypothetical protein